MTAHASAETLSAYLDGELPEGERRETELHLAACPGCHARFASLGRVVASLQRLERAAPPPTLAQDVERRISLAGARANAFDRLEERLRVLGTASPILTTFAVILALGTILYLFAHGVERHQRRGVAIGVPTPEVARQLDAEHARLEPATTRAGDRLFTRSGARWLEHGLERDEATGALAPASTVAADSPAGRALLARLPWLAGLLADAEGVVLRDGDAVVEVRAPPAAGAAAAARPAGSR